MLGRGFVEVRLAFAGGSEFTKKRRPSSSTTAAMCPLVFCANNGARNDAAKIEQKASVALRNHPQFVARLFIHHASAVKAHPIFEFHPHCGHYSRVPRCGQCDFRTMRTGPAVRHAPEPLEVRAGPPRDWSAKTPRERHLCPIPRVQRDESPDWRRLMEPPRYTRTQRHHKARVHYNNASTRDGTLCKAVFRPVVSFPPASARSGLPPPEPPTCLANACISLPAWTLAVRSLVTPATRATFPSSGIPSATTPEPSFWRRLSTSCLSPSRSTFCTSAAITLIPLTTCTRPASSSIWLSAPLRFCASSSFSSCLAVWESFSTWARMPSSPTLSWLATCRRICACCWQCSSAP